MAFTLLITAGFSCAIQQLMSEPNPACIVRLLFCVVICFAKPLLAVLSKPVVSIRWVFTEELTRMWSINELCFNDVSVALID